MSSLIILLKILISIECISSSVLHFYTWAFPPFFFSFFLSPLSPSLFPFSFPFHALHSPSLPLAEEHRLPSGMPSPSTPLPMVQVKLGQGSWRSLLHSRDTVPTRGASPVLFCPQHASTYPLTCCVPLCPSPVAILGTDSTQIEIQHLLGSLSEHSPLLSHQAQERYLS